MLLPTIPALFSKANNCFSRVLCCSAALRSSVLKPHFFDVQDQIIVLNLTVFPLNIYITTLVMIVLTRNMNRHLLTYRMRIIPDILVIITLNGTAETRLHCCLSFKIGSS